MNLLLIQPSNIIEGGKICKAQKIMFPRLSLPVVASLTPPEIPVKIFDDYFNSIHYDQGVDFIGITAMTTQAPQAYQIADEFRKRGKKVVMGGSHATALPEEALNHVDSEGVGEAEGIWNRILKDFPNHRIREI